MPRPGFTNYNLILQDSQAQLEESKKRYPNSKSILYIKPAPDNLFYPMDVKKEFDVCFPANGAQESFKGHPFVFSTSPKDLRVLNLGNKPRKNKVPPRIERVRVLKTEMPKQLQRCKIGIVCCSGKVDSCPRVIPEMLACNIPVVALNETRFWQEKYINSETGILSNRNDFWKNVRYALENINEFNPRKYYEENLSMRVASDYLRNHIFGE